ncbi:MAG: sodium:proton exchanger, partial [Candidatus Dadabacteria bacterium]|nr:sodium:proton exchanger [Candidatus Dadabacteria bacterium]
KINIFLVVGLITFLYMIFRIIGKTVGGIIGGIIAETSENLNKRIGLCTIPQAGVALAMALVVVERFPEIGDQVLSIVIASTIIFEITGPLLLLWQLNKLKEIS